MVQYLLDDNSEGDSDPGFDFLVLEVLGADCLLDVVMPILNDSSSSMS